MHTYMEYMDNTYYICAIYNTYINQVMIDIYMYIYIYVCTHTYIDLCFIKISYSWQDLSSLSNL